MRKILERDEDRKTRRTSRAGRSAARSVSGPAARLRGGRTAPQAPKPPGSIYQDAQVFKTVNAPMGLPGDSPRGTPVPRARSIRPEKFSGGGLRVAASGAGALGSGGRPGCAGVVAGARVYVTEP